MMDKVRHAKLRVIEDAGYADNSGIGNAIAEGYDNIITWSQGTGMEPPRPYLICLRVVHRTRMQAQV